MFNQYVWELYLNAGGTKVVTCFEDNLSKEYTAEYAPFIDDLRREYQLSELILADEMRQLLNLREYFQNGNRFCEEGTSAEDAIDALYIILSENESLDAKETFSIFADTLTTISTILATELPESFVPYYFKWNFNVLQIILQ